MKFMKKIAMLGLCTVMMCTRIHAADLGTVNVDILNVRSGASTETDVIGQLNINTPVSVLENADGWSKIAYAGGEAYVMSQYLNVQFLSDGVTYLYGVPKYGCVNTGLLNMRAFASYEGDIIKTLSQGMTLELIGESGDFYAVQEKCGSIRFVAKAYVDEITYEEYCNGSVAQNVIDVAMNYIGTPYQYGGSSPSGFDCSGFTSYVYAQMGVALNRTAAGQMSNGYYVALEEMQPGDLVFFASGGYVNHVGIYVGDGMMIHSPYSGKTVCIESIYNSYFAPRLYGARRIF